MMHAMVRIQGAAELAGCSPSTIRRLETLGAIPPATRNRSNQRVYRIPEDVDMIRRAWHQQAEPEPLHILEPKGASND